MSVTFTPGPWSTRRAVTPDNVGGYDVAIVDAQRKIIAEAYEITDTGDEGKRPVQANARLIAAAPELYEALIQARQEIHLAHSKDGAVYDPTILTVIDAAIARARGEA